MLNNNSEEIKKILRESDYLATLHQTAKGAILTLPRGGFDYEGQDHESNYKIEYKGKKSILWWNDEIYMIGPEYCMRLLIVFDIYNECTKINYSTKYLEVYDTAGKLLPDDYNLLDIFPLFKSKRQFKLERELLGLFTEAQNDNFLEDYDEIALDLRVEDGYQILKGLFI